MAITQVTAPASVPAAIADYQAQNAHISAFNMIVNNQPFILTNSENTSLPAIAIGSYIQFGGNLYIVDTEDYAITGTPVDGNNYIRISGTTTLTAEWIQDISSYVWNPVYGYKYTGSYAILPYLVIKASTEYTKYSLAMNASFDKLKSTTLDTGYGENQIYRLSSEDIDITASVTTVYNITSMIVGETKMANFSMLYTSDSGIIEIKTPTDGTEYYVSTTLRSNDSSGGNLSGKFSNNARIVSTSQIDLDIKGMIIIKRIS